MMLAFLPSTQMSAIGMKSQFFNSTPPFNSQVMLRTHFWAIDWMSENTHYKAPVSELLRALPLNIPQENAQRIYEQPELRNHMMPVLMKPLAEGEAPPTTFLMKNLLYVPQTLYHIWTKPLCTIKGYNLETEEVVGIMKNMVFHVCQSIPFDSHDFS